MNISKEKENVGEISGYLAKQWKHRRKSESTILREPIISNFIRFIDLEKPNSRELCLESLDLLTIRIWKKNMVSMIFKNY